MHESNSSPNLSDVNIYQSKNKYAKVHKFNGRGTNQNPSNRFDKIDYMKDTEELGDEPRRTQSLYFKDYSKSILSFNDSPDIFARVSLNPYKGCEHGCIYCYARPSHEYLSLSAGIDFESKIFIKHEAPSLLHKTLASKKWEPKIIMFSGNTDCYQPIDKKLKLTRSCLEIMHRFNNPVNLVTKNKLVTRDIDILKKMAEINTAAVFISITTLDNRLASIMEPQTSKPHLKLKAIKELSNAGIPTGVMIAPVIPGLTDSEIPEIIKQASDAGAKYANFVMLRLPHGIKDLFINWLEEYFPERKQKVLNRLISLFGQKMYNPSFHIRGRGKGPFAEQVKDIFKIACRSGGINREELQLTTKHFKNPELAQMDLFN